MAALTAARATDSRNLGPKHTLMAAASKIYAGSLVMINADGYAAPAAALAANGGVVGVAMETVDNSAGAAGDLSITVQEGEFKFAGATLAQTNVGDKVYAADDQTIDETDSGNLPVAGKLVEVVSASIGWVAVGLAYRA